MRRKQVGRCWSLRGTVLSEFLSAELRAAVSSIGRSPVRAADTMETDLTPAPTRPAQKQRSGWTEAVEASYRRSTPARSQLTPEPSESDSALTSESEISSLTDFSGQRVEPPRPLGVHQSAVAPAELSYPSGLHRAGRLMVMAAVTSLCLYRRSVPLLAGLSLPPFHIETFTGGVGLSVI